MFKKMLMLFFLFPLFAYANEYPTAETVRMVVACMAELGAQNEENLLTCACKQDIFEAELTFDEYEQGSLFERYVRMPGKRGNLFRDSGSGRDYVKQLKKAREEAAERCVIVKKITRDTTGK